jgi:diaminopimelate epimerase
VQFAKWHALGNSYLVVDSGSGDGRALRPALVQRLCDPRYGVGADGLLEVVSRREAACEIVIWNPDGSTAEMSGNGTRIAAAWLLRRAGGEAVEIGTAGRTVRARLRPDGLIEQEMGAVRAGPPESIDVGGEEVELIPVDVGNPHAVVPTHAATRELLLRLGPLVERHERFPERTNVQLARPDGPRDVTALVWERGAGETSASGSSAVAVTAAAVALGWCESPVTVHLPGGDLTVELDGTQALLVGPAEEICTGETTF